jgi:hypothetical protein
MYFGPAVPLRTFQIGERLNKQQVIVGVRKPALTIGIDFTVTVPRIRMIP